ncbi:aminotransferase [Parasphingopyxis lamellibrachiae]|uniref:aspartate transaminase n=1 Tax=Parasphingopyxis lamellibrachiae TaxID=680125 RepID=A0A3D9FFE8_9SPHN|nr:aminotransferase [Parasphingopyxis lamellibrachiae]RED16277.1 aspartate/methionine/tyrosine aminotransferase [Parasphingopyxis lamellibrachiae]
MNPVLSALPTTIFEEMSSRARASGAINLGQGFPDSEGPDDVRQVAAEAVLSGWNQYPPMRGIAELRAAIASHYAAHQGLDLDDQSETLVTSGATEALAASILGLVTPGDEVILIQPAYDAYAPLVRQAGGVPRFVTTHPPDWSIAAGMLEAAVGDKTRFIILNSPLNPAATMLGDEELALLADFCVRHDLIAICDEVWEHIVFDGHTHRSLLTMPGMRERTVKIGSAGKIFSLTGWKVGWVIAAAPLSAAIAKAHQFLTFTTPPNLQAAVAYGLGKDMTYFTAMRAGYQASRDRLTDALSAGGYAVLPGMATYFLSIDLTRSGLVMTDRDFAIRLVEEAGVAVIPISPFFETEPVTNIVRLCFAKSDDVLDSAAEKLAAAHQLFA